jgi:hypothetical protein
VSVSAPPLITSHRQIETTIFITVIILIAGRKIVSTMSDRPSDDETDASLASRRRILQGLGSAVGLGALSGVVGATGSDSDATATGSSRSAGYSLRQGEACLPLAPLRGDESVERMYDYRVPERYASADNGATDPGSGPYFSSVGVQPLERANTSLLFLYEGPEGLSLVAVHGAVGDGSGGAARFTVSGVPSSATWAVKDDLYRDPDTGDVAGSNYDRWKTRGDRHRIDWTWGDGGTDGGALRGLGAEFHLRIDPAFNDDAPLYGEHYEGDVSDWYALVPGREGITGVSLSMDEPVVIQSGGCEVSRHDLDTESVAAGVRRNRTYVHGDDVDVSVAPGNVDVRVDEDDEEDDERDEEEDDERDDEEDDERDDEEDDERDDEEDDERDDEEDDERDDEEDDERDDESDEEEGGYSWSGGRSESNGRSSGRGPGRSSGRGRGRSSEKGRSRSSGKGRGPPPWSGQS